MIAISDKQEEMLAFIESFLTRNGYPPTYDEIKDGLSISTKSLVNYHLKALESAQLLSRVPNTPRGIRLAQPNKKAVQVSFNDLVDERPLNTSLTEEQILELTYGCVTNDNHLYALKVNNHNLPDSFAGEGDIIIVQEQDQVNNGEMVAVKLQDQTTLRRYYRENGHVRLQADNPALEDMIVNPNSVEVQGKVVAIIRQSS